jgi:NADPH-dependent glutamate synthase beta subunit-like oxidoreductase/coenzyme F420-reducing hydrogenase delta subunit/Pyruvate/2-oxoacid:ferredoxin oxidoreductase delta subunit
MSEVETKTKEKEPRGAGSGQPEKTHFPPCRAACPVNTDVQNYIWLISQGRYTDALDVIRSVNPIASACSLICHHPCEQQCRRCGVDEPVGIRPLKRFALEQATEYRRSKRKAVPKTRGKSIGIIGSGPAGLTAASDLADMGYGVTIYEKNPDLGGMLSAAIPTYRLSRDSLTEDIDDVLSKGVEAVTNCAVGTDVTLAELQAKHDAVLMAVGLSLSRGLNLPGMEGEGVLLALPFLFDAIYEKPMNLGKKVLVIGGGNVAIDVARTARRLGVEKVEMVCLESEEEMPAWEWEVEEAADEAITIAHRWGPRAVKRSNGGVEGLEVVRVTSVFDSEGRFSPTFDENETKLIEADTIIISIGQMTDTSFLTDGPVKVDERGRVEWDRDTQMSSASGVFVSGEVVTGPGSAIQAAASGHRAAQAIHLYLEGEDVAAGLVEEEKERIGDLPPDVAAKVYRQSREETELRDAATRCRDFTQIEISWDEMTALKEARRCRSCGGGAVVDPDKCMACLTCMRVCPYDAPVVTHTSVISPDRCQACGLCPPECPGRAISMFGYDIDDIRERMPETVGSVEAGRGEPVVVAFMCSKYALDRSEGPAELPENVRPVQVHCASRVDVLDMLKAFECGADGVSVVLCEEGQCRHEGVPKRVVQRVRHVRQLLGEMGRTDCVGYVRTREGLDWRGALVESIGSVPVRTKSR